MIELKETTYVHTIWFCSDGRKVDWMAALLRQESGPLECVYRFRYYRDDLAHGSEDVKNWYTVTFKRDDPGEAARTVGEMAGKIAEEFHGELHVLPVRGDGPMAVEFLARESWASARPLAPGEEP